MYSPPPPPPPAREPPPPSAPLWGTSVALSLHEPLESTNVDLTDFRVLCRNSGGTAERGTTDAVLLHERSRGREHGGQTDRLRQDLHQRRDAPVSKTKTSNRRERGCNVVFVL